MKKLALLILAIAFGFSTAPAFAAATSYQVTGPVIALTDDTITIQKGAEKWVISRGDANVPSSVAVGSKVTIQYSMIASTVIDKSPAVAATPNVNPTPTATSTANSLSSSTMATKPGMRR